MMGKANDPDEMGIIPRLCNDLFARIDNNNDKDVQYSVEVIIFDTLIHGN